MSKIINMNVYDGQHCQHKQQSYVMLSHKAEATLYSFKPHGYMRHPLSFSVKLSKDTDFVITTVSVSMCYYARQFVQSPAQSLRPQPSLYLCNA